MKFVKKNVYKIIIITFLIVLPVFSFAQSDVPPPADICPDGKICNPISTNTIQEFIRVLLEGMLKIGIPLVALAVIYCGFLFVQARGKPEEITKAKDALFWTLIGAAILLGALGLAELISSTVIDIAK